MPFVIGTQTISVLQAAREIVFKLTYNCAHLSWTKGSLTVEFEKNVQKALRYALKQKKRYYLGIFPKCRTPPNSELVEVVTVADVDFEDHVGNSLLQIWELTFGPKTKLFYRL